MWNAVVVLSLTQPAVRVVAAVCCGVALSGPAQALLLVLHVGNPWRAHRAVCAPTSSERRLVAGGGLRSSVVCFFLPPPPPAHQRVSAFLCAVFHHRNMRHGGRCAVLATRNNSGAPGSHGAPRPPSKLVWRLLVHKLERCLSVGSRRACGRRVVRRLLAASWCPRYALAIHFLLAFLWRPGLVYEERKRRREIKYNRQSIRACA